MDEVPLLAELWPGGAEQGEAHAIPVVLIKTAVNAVEVVGFFEQHPGSQRLRTVCGPGLVGVARGGSLCFDLTLACREPSGSKPVTSEEIHGTTRAPQSIGNGLARLRRVVELEDVVASKIAHRSV
jgi:hypothetical protein